MKEVVGALQAAQARELEYILRLDDGRVALEKAQAQLEQLRGELNHLESEREALRHEVRDLRTALPPIYRMPFAGEYQYKEPDCYGYAGEGLLGGEVFWLTSPLTSYDTQAMSLAEHETINAPSPDSILSHCKGALLPMFTQAEATTLRLVCCEFKEAVEEYPWGEEKASSVIYGKVKDWRKCFPNALCANLTGVDRTGYKEDSATGRGYYPEDVEDFQHLRGVRKVIMTRAFGLESGHLEQLSGVHTLILRDTSLLCIAFPKLEGLHTLDLGGCENVGERELVHLEGLHTLILRDCKDLSDRVFNHLPGGLHTLSVRRCEYLSDAVFEHLPKDLRALDVRGCHITDSAFVHFQHLHTLTLDCCDHFTQAAAEWLSKLKVLRVFTPNGRFNSGYFVHYVQAVGGREVSIDFVSYHDD